MVCTHNKHSSLAGTYMRSLQPYYHALLFLQFHITFTKLFKYLTCSITERWKKKSSIMSVIAKKVGNRELKQRWRRRLRKRPWKSEFTLRKSLPRLFISFNSSNVGKVFWGWILKDYIKSWGKEKKSYCLVSRPRQFRHVVVVHRRQRNVQKAWCTCKVVVLPPI